MKFLTVRDLRGKSAQVWKDLARERELVVTNRRWFECSGNRWNADWIA
ncbi:MAG: hypothetical protein NTW86_25770 [Candidatus Sumerlaeota bacterium]|nr:hypothetical protein [Candidatus Sumerlaeota bacterium]